jgi:hypothetical protein
MLKLNHIKADRSFEGFHKLAVPLLVDHILATLEASHKLELIEEILKVIQMFEEVSKSLQQLKAIIN